MRRSWHAWALPVRQRPEIQANVHLAAVSSLRSFAAVGLEAAVGLTVWGWLTCRAVSSSSCAECVLAGRCLTASGL